MDKCKSKSCNEHAVFLEQHCWDHLSERGKADYPKKLLNHLGSNRNIQYENFRSIVIKDIVFPEQCRFENCYFNGACISHCSFLRSQFRGTDFSNAFLKDCHFEYSDFRGGNTKLMNAYLRESNFEGALLQNTNLTNSDLRDAIFIKTDMVGAMLKDTKLYSARIFETRLRKESLCNFELKNPRRIKVGDESYKFAHSDERNPCTVYDPSDIDGPKPLYARFVYNMLMNNFRSIGYYEDERWARKKERIMERKRLYRLATFGDRFSDEIAIERCEKEDKDKLFESRKKAFWRWCCRLLLSFLGYGEAPLVFLYLSALTIVLFALLFLLFGFEYTIGSEIIIIRCNIKMLFSETSSFISDFWSSLYFSIVTFTTLGYGDAKPIGITKLFSSIEALTGFFIYSSFVATLLKRLSDK